MTPIQWVMLLSQASDAYLRVEEALEQNDLPIGNIDVDLAITQFEQRQKRLGERFEAEMLRLKAQKTEPVESTS